jgi:hypothetical protein
MRQGELGLVICLLLLPDSVQWAFKERSMPWRGMASYLDATCSAAKDVLGSLTAAGFTDKVRGFFCSSYVRHHASQKTFADFEQYAWSISDNGLSVARAPSYYLEDISEVRDTDDCPLDEFLVLDSKPKEFYGKAWNGVSEELVLTTIVSGYQRIDPERGSGRHWVIEHPLDARQIMRAIASCYATQRNKEALEDRKRLSAERHVGLIITEMGLDRLTADHELDWCRELDSTFSEYEPV